MIGALSLNFFIGDAAAEQRSVVKKEKSKGGKFTSYHPTLKEAVKTIEKLPEASALIDEVQSGGTIGVDAQVIDSFDFEAMWNSGTRKIIVNAKKNKSLGKTICSILFELHNAKTNKQLVSLFAMAQKGTISKSEYVERVERMEHENAVATNKLIEKGIQMGIFPEETRWPIFEDFDDHYMIQQIYGHSQWIANNFDTMNPANKKDKFKSTIAGLEEMSDSSKNELANILTLKNRIRNKNPKIAKDAEAKLQEMIKKLELCENDPSNPLCDDHSKKKKLLEIAFQNKPASYVSQK
jgi:hypothetical protein